jgi:hypothetical protein
MLRFLDRMLLEPISVFETGDDGNVKVTKYNVLLAEQKSNKNNGEWRRPSRTRQAAYQKAIAEVAQKRQRAAQVLVFVVVAADSTAAAAAVDDVGTVIPCER